MTRDEGLQAQLEDQREFIFKLKEQIEKLEARPPCACGGGKVLAVVDDWLGDVVPGCAIYLAGHGLVFMGLPEDATEEMKPIRVIIFEEKPCS